MTAVPTAAESDASMPSPAAERPPTPSVTVSLEGSPLDRETERITTSLISIDDAGRAPSADRRSRRSVPVSNVVAESTACCARAKIRSASPLPPAMTTSTSCDVAPAERRLPREVPDVSAWTVDSCIHDADMMVNGFSPPSVSAPSAPSLRRCLPAPTARWTVTPASAARVARLPTLACIASTAACSFSGSSSPAPRRRGVRAAVAIRR
jgi:hypothetical protein